MNASPPLFANAMPDRNAPRFGVFVTPYNDPPRHAVELAKHAEQVGLDLVTFQDHPYQPRFHDTVALLAWTSAETERIRLASAVHVLPLRRPAVLAKQAATIDLLSGGRFELGLGAGGFWDAIEAMGGPRRTPGEAVAALDEAIDVIRGLWDTESRERLEAGGQHYRVSGAKRGPAPAHDMEIWVGAYGPKMMGLIGRKADGWLPSIGRVPFDELRERARQLDEAAVAAGRSPAEIRRIANLGLGESAFDPGRLADLIVALARELRFSTFTLATDDPAVIEAYATLVAPRARAEIGVNP